MDINKPQKEQTLPGSKDTLLEGESYIAVRFNGRKKVLSSAPHNGGMYLNWSRNCCIAVRTG